jgi:hypothetical protein
MKTMRYVLAILLMAWATLASAVDLTLDPLLNESGDIPGLACTEDPNDNIPSCTDLPFSGHDDFTLQILNAGFLNSIADVALVPDDTGTFFSSFVYQIQESGPTMVASANGPGVQSAPPNAPVTIGIYHVIVDWTLSGPASIAFADIAAQVGLQQAGYTIHVSTTATPVAAVPEPGTLMLMGAAVLAIVVLRRRRVR